MKLYFYFLSEKEMTVEEYEVEEKPHSYKLINKSPKGFLTGDYINKNIIGVVTKESFYYDLIVVLENKDNEKAKELFLEYLSKDISYFKKELEEKISIFEKEKKIVQEFESGE